MSSNDNQQPFPFSGTINIELHLHKGQKLPRIPAAAKLEGEMLSFNGRIARGNDGFLIVVDDSQRGPGGEITLPESAVKAVWGDSIPLLRKL